MKTFPISSKRRERGVALLLALGFSALLLVMVMAFVTNALLENKVAVNTSSRTHGHIFGDTALSQALKIINAYVERSNQQDNGIVRFDHMVSRNDPTSAADLTKFKKGANTSRVVDANIAGMWDFFQSVTDGGTEFPCLMAAGDILYVYPVTDLDDTLDPSNLRITQLVQPQWQYLKVKDKSRRGASDTDDPEVIVGRFAYMALPDQGTIHKSMFYGVWDTAMTGTAPRNGRFPQEVSLAPFYEPLGASGASTAAEKNAKVKETSQTDLKYPRQILTALADSNRAQSLAARQVYSMVDFSDVPYTDKRTQFNLWTTADTFQKADLCEWKTIGTAGGITTPEDLITKLPILGRMKPTSNTFDSEDAWRKQVAANILDYFDKDNIPTISPEADEQGIPNYTGNERTPYIESLALSFCTKFTGVAVKPDPVNQPSSIGWESISSSVVSLSASGRIFNYFPTEKGKSYELQVTIHATITPEKFTINGNNVPSGSLPEKADITKTFTIPITLSGADGTGLFVTPDDSAENQENGAKKGVPDGNPFQCTLSDMTPHPSSTGITFTATLKYSNVRVEKAILKEAGSGVIVDYVKTLSVSVPSTPTSTVTLQKKATGSGSNYASIYATLNAKDPRQNLNAGNWTTPTFSKSTSQKDYTSGFATHKNSNFPSDPAATPTQDPLVDTPYYIRNGTMETSAEFSLIHRAEPKKLINLAKAADPENTSIGPDDGDAGILDQVCYEKYTVQPLDMNTRSDIIWQMIFKGVNYSPVKLKYKAEDAEGQTAELDLDSGMVFSDAQLETLARAVRHTFRVYKYFFRTPSQLMGNVMTRIINFAKDPTIGDASFPDLTTEQKTALAAKVIPLLRASPYPDSFFLIVLAQGIQDVGNTGGTLNISRIDRSGAAQTKQCKLGTLDAMVDPSDSSKLLYFDRITSSVRMLAKIKRNNTTGKYEVEYVEYLTEGK